MKTIQQFIKNWKNIKDKNITFSEDEWMEISSYEYLSEDFIEKYENKVDWARIFAFQALSIQFIYQYHRKGIYLNALKQHRRVRYEALDIRRYQTNFIISDKNYCLMFIVGLYYRLDIKNIPFNITFCQLL